MYLSRIHLDCRCKEARRDLANPYQLHSTLCRAFSPPDKKCPKGEFLWRLEPETDEKGNPRILVQSRKVPDWSRINISNWLSKFDPPFDLIKKLNLQSIEPGHKFRFRLRANPCVCRKGKRYGLLKVEEQEKWLKNKGRRHGFLLPRLCFSESRTKMEDRIDVRITQENLIRDKQRSGNHISIFSVLYDGVMCVSDPDIFNETIQKGIGHGKCLGLGMLSVVPII